MKAQGIKAAGSQKGLAGIELWAVIVWLGVFGFTGYWVGMSMGYPRLCLAAYYGSGGMLVGRAGFSLILGARFVPASIASGWA